MALFANSLRCNGASAAEGRPSVARLASLRQPVTQTNLSLNPSYPHQAQDPSYPHSIGEPQAAPSLVPVAASTANANRL